MVCSIRRKTVTGRSRQRNENIILTVAIILSIFANQVKTIYAAIFPKFGRDYLVQNNVEINLLKRLV